MSAAPKPEGNVPSVGRERRPTPLSGRSRKRAVSTGGRTGRSDSRLVYTQPLAPLEANLKSFSLGFNFNPPTPGTVSFTSTGSGKWWKSKFGLKKLVNSVRRKKKKLAKNEYSQQALLEKSELDLKKRRLDFEKEIRNKGLHTHPTAVSKMESMPLAPPVVQGIEESKDKSEFHESMTPPSVEAATSRVGPGGETLKQQPATPTTTHDAEKDASFRTPSESNSELNTESEASFVMCESTEELSTTLKNCKIDDKSPSTSAPSTNESAADDNNVINTLSDTKCPATTLPSSKDTTGTGSGGDVEMEPSRSPDNPTAQLTRSGNPPAPIVEEHSANKVKKCQNCSCACSAGAGLLQPNSWLPFVVLALAMIAGFCFQYYFLFL